MMYSTVLLPRGRIQEIKRMLLVHLTHGLFLTWTQISHFIYRLYTTIFTWQIMPHPTQPLAFHNITWFYLPGEPASFLVVTNTHPPLSPVCQQLLHPLLCPSHPFTPHSSNYITYIYDISNLGCLRLGQVHLEDSFLYWRADIGSRWCSNWGPAGVNTGHRLEKKRELATIKSVLLKKFNVRI
jgi:hypothetical protein